MNEAWTYAYYLISHTVTLTGGEITTSDEVPTLLPAASIQIEQGTFVSVVVVAVVIAVVLCLVIVVAVAMAIYYRKRLKDSQQERVNDSTREMA